MHGRVRGEVQLAPLISCWNKTTPCAAIVAIVAIVKGKIHLQLVCLDTARCTFPDPQYGAPFTAKGGSCEI